MKSGKKKPKHISNTRDCNKQDHWLNLTKHLTNSNPTPITNTESNLEPLE